MTEPEKIKYDLMCCLVLGGSEREKHEALLSIVNDAARVTAEAAAMAASVKVFIDTMVAQGGGDLIDMMEEDEHADE